MSVVQFDLPTSDRLLLEYENDWLTIWLNTPENRNALSQEMMADLSAVLSAVRPRRSVRGSRQTNNGPR